MSSGEGDLYPNTELLPRLGRFSLVFSIQVAVTSFFYGIYCVFFAMAIIALRWVLLIPTHAAGPKSYRRKGLQTHRMRFLLALLSLMFILSSIILGLIYTAYFFTVQRLMLDLGARPTIDWLSEISSLNNVLHCVDNAQYLTTMVEVLLADVLVVGRVWFLCRGNRSLHFLLVSPCIASFGCIVAYIVAFVQGKQMNQTTSYWNLMPTVDLALSILVNIVALAITVRQIWFFTRSSCRPFFSGYSNHSRIMRVMRIFVHSGSMYILLWIVFLIAFSPIHRPNIGTRIFVTVLADICGQVVGIYPCILIIMLHNSAWKLDYTDVLHNIEIPPTQTTNTIDQPDIPAANLMTMTTTIPHIVFAPHDIPLQRIDALPMDSEAQGIGKQESIVTQSS